MFECNQSYAANPRCYSLFDQCFRFIFLYSTYTFTCAMNIENKPIKPKTLERYDNSIVLSWKHNKMINNCEKFQLQILDEFKEWITLYRGNRTQYTVCNLAPSQVYTFRIKLKESTDWLVFRSGTHTGPFYTNRHLMSAIRSQKFGLIRKIIKARHDLLEIENKKCNTPLVHAILDNDLKMVNLLLHLGSDINKPLTYSKKTPLMVAVSHGFFDLIKFLVNKGACLNDKDINGLSLLHIGVDSGDYEIVQYFVEFGLDVNAMDRHGLTPLLRAVIFQVDDRILDFLIVNGASKNIRDINGFDFNDHMNIIK